jgi:hypothetical protein
MEMDKTKTYISITEYIACFINLCKVGLFIFIFLDSIVGGMGFEPWMSPLKTP